MNWHLAGEITFWVVDIGLLLLGGYGWLGVRFLSEDNNQLTNRNATLRAELERAQQTRGRAVAMGWEEAARWEARYRRQCDLCTKEHVDRPLAVNPLTADKIRELEAQLEEMF